MAVFEKEGLEPAPLEAAAEFSPAAAGPDTAAVDGVLDVLSVDDCYISGVVAAISGVVAAVFEVAGALDGVTKTGAAASGVADSSVEDSVVDG